MISIKNPITPSLILITLTLTVGPTLHATGWPGFRGPNASGIAKSKLSVTEFKPGVNQLWHSDIGSGHSSPCIVGNRIFLNEYNEQQKQLSVICLDRQTGKLNWRQKIDAGKIETGHPSFNPASSTPTSDGQHVVSYFGSFGLVCFTVEGEKQWEIKMPLARSYSGNATSPVIVGDLVILYRANYVDHFLLAVDKQTGKERWKKPQEERFTTSMAAAATPIIFEDKIIIHGVRAVKCYQTKTGEHIWTMPCSTTGTSTPVLGPNEIFIATWNQTGEPALVPVFPPYDELIEQHDKNSDGLIAPNELPRLMYFHRAEGAEAPENGAPLRFGHVDKNRNKQIDAEEWEQLLTRTNESRKKHHPHGVVAIDLDSKGYINEKGVRYLERRSIPEVPSPVYKDGKLYFVKNGGILTCIDTKTGKRLYRMRTGGKGTHYASLIIAGDKLISTSGFGEVSVIDISSPDAKILHVNEFKERIFATPAIIDGIIYIRTHKGLYAFGKK